MKYSIIIVAYKAFDHLARCLRSIRCSRIEDCEVILVDNSPTPAPAELLGWTEAHIWDGNNRGFAAACNEGAKVARGKYLIFLNPDTMVFGDWADRLENHLLLSDSVGAVGPISDFSAGYQSVVHHMGTKDPAKPLESKVLIGYCLMMRRMLFLELDGMDPKCFLGCDDLDLSWRLQRKGYRMLIAPDVFVHHAGHKSMEEEPDAHIKELTLASQEHLRKKLWEHYKGVPPTAKELWDVDFFYTGPEPDPTISVCMIVRDEEANLRALLPTLDFADEVVVVDTGSKDDTERAFWEAHGMDPSNFLRGALPAGTLAPNGKKRVALGRFPWCGDFAAARNYALQLCTKGWVLWLDADDRVPEDTCMRLRALKAGRLGKSKDRLNLNKADRVFLFNVVNINHDDSRGEAFAQLRMFPRIPSLTWEHRIHETVGPKARQAGLKEYMVPNLVIEHHGYKDPALCRAKYERNLALLKEEEWDQDTLMHLGNTSGLLGNHEMALAYLMLAWDLKTFEDPFWDHVAFLIGWEYDSMGILEKAREWFERSKKPDALYRLGEVLVKLDFRAEAKECFQRYLDEPERPQAYGSFRTAYRYNALMFLLELNTAESKRLENALKREYPHMVEEHG